MLGVKNEVFQSEYLVASYLKPKAAGMTLLNGMNTDKLAFRGEVAYCTPEKGTEVLATLIPPFAPYEVVGAPPERASIPVEQTDIPLVTRKICGKGNLVFLPFSAGALIREYHLADHYRFLGKYYEKPVRRRTQIPDGCTSRCADNGLRKIGQYFDSSGK